MGPFLIRPPRTNTHLHLSTPPRRTDCHFSLDRAHDMTPNEGYTKALTDQINGVGGRVYLDTQRPRVCIAGPEDR